MNRAALAHLLLLGYVRRHGRFQQVLKTYNARCKVTRCKLTCLGEIRRRAAFWDYSRASRAPNSTPARFRAAPDSTFTLSSWLSLISSESGS